MSAALSPKASAQTMRELRQALSLPYRRKFLTMIAVIAARILSVCLVAGLALAPVALHAHDPGLSTATLQLESNKLEAVLGFSVADAGEIVELDKDRDGQISKAELAKAVTELQE